MAYKSILLRITTSNLETIFLRILLLGFIISSSDRVFAQKQNPLNANQVKKDIAWYGLDFSISRLIGSTGFSNPGQIKNYYFPTWNDFIANEVRRKLYGRKSPKMELTLATNSNNKVDHDKMIVEGSYEITESSISQLVRSYAQNRSYVGVLYVVESLNKYLEKVFVWVVIFESETGDIIFCRRYEGHASGFGIRNYWINAFKEIIGNSGKEISLK